MCIGAKVETWFKTTHDADCVVSNLDCVCRIGLWHGLSYSSAPMIRLRWFPNGCCRSEVTLVLKSHDPSEVSPQGSLPKGFICLYISAPLCIKAMTTEQPVGRVQGIVNDYHHSISAYLLLWYLLPVPNIHDAIPQQCRHQSHRDIRPQSGSCLALPCLARQRVWHADGHLQCLDQALFEQHQGVSPGKYTIGLGLKYMNYCDDREGKRAERHLGLGSQS